MRRLLSLALLLLVCSPLLAAPRNWRSTDGKSSFQGDYVSHDEGHVTIRRSDGRLFTLELTKLHADDRDWIAREKGGPAEDAPHPDAVFDTLCFGDGRQEVEAKLKRSKLVESAVDETFLGRFGLNGVFRTRQKVGGMPVELFFDWSEAGRLKEITLQSPACPFEAYDEDLRRSWKEFASLLTTLHGKPLQTSAYPKAGDLANDLFLASHLWRIQGGGSVLLGTSMQENKYLVVVRFTAERINLAPGP